MQKEEIQNIYNETVLPSYREMGKNFQKVESSTVEVPPTPPKSAYYCAKMKHIGKHWKKRFLDRFGYLGFYLLITVILIVGSFLVHYFAIHSKFFCCFTNLEEIEEDKKLLSWYNYAFSRYFAAETTRNTTTTFRTGKNIGDIATTNMITNPTNPSKFLSQIFFIARQYQR